MPNIIKKELSIDVFHKMITNHIKKLAPVKCRKYKNVHENVNWVYIGGMYHGDLDKDRKKCIELIFEYSFLDPNLYISINKYKSICKLIADTLLHEIIHMKQYRSRRFKILANYRSNSSIDYIRREQEYLGCPDEMDAYSFNIACELKDHFEGNVSKIKKFLNQTKLERKKISPSWNKYVRAFEKNYDHPIIQKLKKKIIKYLPMANIGKPYRRNNWINH